MAKATEPDTGRAEAAATMTLTGGEVRSVCDLGTPLPYGTQARAPTGGGRAAKQPSL